MNRQRTPHTPYLDAWRESLRAATDGRGLKAELARHLAASRSQSPAVWQIRLAKIFSGASIPNGEDVLEISAWMAARKTPKTTTSPRGRHRPPARLVTEA